MSKAINGHRALDTTRIESVPIFDDSIEKAVLHCLLFSKDLQGNIHKLELGDFYREENKKIFKLFLKMIAKDYRIDPMLLPMEQRSVIHRLSEQTNDLVLTSNWDNYYNRLKELSAYRKIQDTCYEATRKTKEKKPIASIKNYVISEIQAIKDREDSSGQTDVVDSDFENIIADETLIAVKTGFPKLDHYCHGFMKASLNIIASYPRAGKTTFVLNMIRNICAKQNKKVLIASLEMDYVELHAKLVSLLSGIKFDDLIFKKLQTEDWQKVNNARAEISSWQLDRIGEKDISPADIEMEAKERKPDIIFVDYLQLMNANVIARTIRENITNLSRELKQVARRSGIPIVAVSAINRGYSTRDDKRPKLADLRESSQIEFDAGLVLMLHRESLFRDWSLEKDEMTEDEFEKHAELIIAKNRFGKDNIIVDMYFDGATSLIAESYAGSMDENAKGRADIYG